jgi:hypothetical protein
VIWLIAVVTCLITTLVSAFWSSSFLNFLFLEWSRLCAIQDEVTPEQIQAVVNFALYVCVRVRVTYRDAFGKRYSNFGYYVQKQGFGFLPKYNDSN